MSEIIDQNGAGQPNPAADAENRERVIVRTSMVGIVTNVFLAAFRLRWDFFQNPSP